MATDVNVDDFQIETTGELPLSEAPPPESTPPPTPPVETPAPEPEPPDTDPAEAPIPEPKAATGERNPDGTFKAKQGWHRIQELTRQREEASREAIRERERREDLERRLAALE